MRDAKVVINMLRNKGFNGHKLFAQQMQWSKDQKL